MSEANPMNMMLPIPGTTSLCHTCRNWFEVAWANGHPTPCCHVRWEGTRHVLPSLERDADGVVCGDFAAMEDHVQ